MRKLIILFTLLFTLPAVPALAEEAVEAGIHPAAHEAQARHQFLVGLKGTTQTAMGAEGSEGWEPGVGVFAAWVASPGLEVELAAKNVFKAEGEGLSVPVELLLKHPFGHDAVQPYVGAGPAFVLNTAEEVDNTFGINVVAGTYWWLLQNVGVSAEATYGIALNGEHVAPELGVGLGLVTAF